MNNELTITSDEVEDIALAIAVAVKGLELPLFVDNKFDNLESKIDLLLDVLFCGISKNCSK